MNFWNYAKAAADFAVAGAQIYGAYQQSQSAKETAKIQKQELLRQQRVAEAQARREARVRTAYLQASQGRAGVQFSGTQAGIIGIGTTLKTEVENLAETTQHNIGMVESQKDAAQWNAAQNAFLGVATFAATGKEFSDMLGTTDTQSLAQTQANYPYIARR